MLHFDWPWMVLLLIPPLLLLLGKRQPGSGMQDQRERRVTLLHTGTDYLLAAFAGTHRPGTSTGNRINTLLLSLLWLGLVVALMRPEWLEAHTEERVEGYDLMLVLDTSRSMTAIDFSQDGRPVSRMQVVKGVMTEFVGGREGDRLGLIIFGNNAYVLSPLTLDRNSIKQQLDDLTAGIVGDATAMGDAIGLGVAKLRERPEGSRVLILVADGDNSAGLIPPLEAARLAAAEQVRIYAIGVASTEDKVKMLATDYATYEEATGMALDEDALRRIAETTGGAYFRATDKAALEQIYQRIDQLEKSQVESLTVLIPHPLYRWPLALALLALLGLGLFPGGRMRRLTRSENA